jgi:hypothetical protein
LPTILGYGRLLAREIKKLKSEVLVNDSVYAYAYDIVFFYKAILGIVIWML